MGMREVINRNPAIPIVAGILLLGVAIWVVYSTVTDRGLTAELPSQYYFTVDEGKTLFAAPVTTVPPFSKDGQEAVRAHVFTCDKGKTQFVGYLAKYREEFAKRAAAEGEPAEGRPSALQSPAAPMNMLVKKPGGEWMPYTSPQAQDLAAITCPSGDPWDLVELHPK